MTTESVETLRADLEDAAAKFADNEVLGALQSLHAVTEFLKRENMKPRGVMVPLIWVSDKITSEHLNLPGKTPFEAAQLGCAAATVDILKENGMTIDGACRAVAGKTAGKYSAAQVRDFRKTIGRGTANQDAIEFYHHHKKDARKRLEGASDRELIKKAVLAGVANLFGKKG